MNFSSDPINTLENLIAKNETKSFSIYFIVLLVILIFLGLLTIIKVDISSRTDNVLVATIVSGRVNWVNFKKTFVKIRRYTFKSSYSKSEK
jgi:hypothetical protein